MANPKQQPYKFKLAMNIFHPLNCFDVTPASEKIRLNTKQYDQTACYMGKKDISVGIGGGTPSGHTKASCKAGIETSKNKYHNGIQ